MATHNGTFHHGSHSCASVGPPLFSVCQQAFTGARVASCLARRPSLPDVYNTCARHAVWWGWDVGVFDPTMSGLLNPFPRLPPRGEGDKHVSRCGSSYGHPPSAAEPRERSLHRCSFAQLIPPRPGRPIRRRRVSLCAPRIPVSTVSCHALRDIIYLYPALPSYGNPSLRGVHGS